MRLPSPFVLVGLAALLLSPVTALALDPAKSLFQFNCKNWNRLSGLPADRISAIAQDKKGYIWLGSQNGLVRFDGQSFAVVSIDLPSARGSSISSLKLAGNGVLWFSIGQGGFGGFDGQKFIPLADGLWDGGSEASTLMLARDGSAIWTATVNGWGRWVPGVPQETIPVRVLNSIISFSEEKSGRVWFGSAMEGLYYWENGAVKAFADDRLKTLNIHAIARDGNNDLWVGTNGGLFQYDPELRPKAFYFSDTQTTSLLVDRHGVLWVGTSATGLLRYQDGKFAQLGRLQGLGSDDVTSLFEDEEGSLWIGTAEGVSQLSDLKFPIYSATEGLSEGSATSVAASPGGGLWIGTNTGASYFDGRRIINIKDRSVLPNLYVRRIFVAQNGDVYLGDGSRNLIVWRDNAVVARFTHELWPEAFLDDGADVIAGIGSHLFRIRGDRLLPYEFEGPAPEFNWINDLARATDGSIWAATNAGLFRIEGGKFQRWSEADGLPPGKIHCLEPDANGGMWCGLTTGLVRMANGRMTHVRVRDGLSDGRIFAIVPDNHGAFWISSGRGILRVSRENLNAFADGKVSQIECTTYDGLESIKVIDRTDQGFTGCRTADGHIWFPTPRGVVMIDPDAHFFNKVAPKVHIERVRIDEREVSEVEATNLGANNRKVEFFFNALSFVAPEKMQVKYQLEGSDPAWIDGSSRRSASYQNLPPGEYVFRIKAANADGIWSTEEKSFAITFPPPFYTRSWFFALCGLTAAGGLYGGYQVKMRRLRQHQRRLQEANDDLEAKVAQRTDELASSLSLLQATLDSTADGIIAIKYSGEVVSHNLQFARMWRLPAELASSTSGQDLNQYLSTQVKNLAAFESRLAAIRNTNEEEAFDVIELNDGRVLERYCRPQLMKGERVGIVMNYRDITARKQAEEKLDQAHRQLLEISRQAGMAEVATSVLHNVGNVLNSVNVSATLVTDKVRESKVTFVTRVADLLVSNAADLASFLTSDPRGRKLVPYLSDLSLALRAEQESITTELTHLSKNVEHIKEIVAMQQSFARVSGVSETVHVKELIEDALRMNCTSFARHHVAIACDYIDNPQINIDRHKVMQILVNLISNAKDACSAERTGPDKAITLRTSVVGDRVQISVTDTGVGIPKENLTRIFAHGFTTKREGHGFGLHSAALTANELGGSLLAQSKGLGCGASFTLELPLALSAAAVAA